MPFAPQRLSVVQLWTALADEAQRPAIGAASRGREVPRQEASGMGGSKGKGAGGRPVGRRHPSVGGVVWPSFWYILKPARQPLASPPPGQTDPV